jgi:hypothetical protein
MSRIRNTGLNAGLLQRFALVIIRCNPVLRIRLRIFLEAGSRSGSAFASKWKVDPDPDPDPRLHTTGFRIRNTAPQGFFLIFFLLMEGFVKRRIRTIF